MYSDVIITITPLIRALLSKSGEMSILEAASSSLVVAPIQSELEAVATKIGAIEASIVKIDSSIELKDEAITAQAVRIAQLEADIERDAGDSSYLKQMRADAVSHLTSLREELKDLREEKKDLRDKEKDLRDKEKDLRDKERVLLNFFLKKEEDLRARAGSAGA
jgi:chromosome segregation ATPase